MTEDLPPLKFPAYFDDFDRDKAQVHAGRYKTALLTLRNIKDPKPEQLVTIAASRGGGVSEPYAAKLGGARFVGCDATWPDAEVETVLHANLFHVAGAGDTAYLVHLTGAVGGPAAETDYDLIRGVLTTVRVQPWAAPAPTTQEHDA